MKKLTLLLLSALVSFSAAADRYKDRLFDVSVERDVSFAKGVPHLSSYHKITEALMVYGLLSDDATIVYFYTTENEVAQKDLKLDLYKPKGDKETSRPAVIVAHGGAMVAGSKNDYAQHTVNYCDSLAARGFVTASIEYRLGVTLTDTCLMLPAKSVTAVIGLSDTPQPARIPLSCLFICSFSSHRPRCRAVQRRTGSPER